MQFLNLFVKRNLAIFWGGISLIFFSGLANIALIKFISKGFERDSLYFSEQPYIFITLLTAAFAFGIAAQWILEGIGHTFVYNLRNYLLTQILQTEPEHFQTLEKSKLLNAFSKDIPQILTAIEFAPYMFYGITLIIGGAIYMLWLSWTIALLIISLLIISMVGSNKLVSHCQTLILRERELHNGLVDYYNNIIDGHNELALNEHRAHAIFQNILCGDALESKNLLSKAGRIVAISSQFMGVLPLLLIGLVCWINHQWHIGSATLVIGFALTLMFIRQPIGNLVHQIEVMVHAKIALQNLEKLNLIDPYEFDPAETLNENWNTLTMKNVSYQYAGNDNFSFGPISLTVNRGEMLFLVGKNGAGKSTLIKLLSGLLTPTQGNIYVNNEIVLANNRRRYRAMFSAVLSENYLFNSFLKNNFDSQSKQYAEILIERFQLEHIALINDKQFNTKNLSTGQKKRLAMIISLMENRTIMILDEWAADQDPKFRKYFYEHVLPELKTQGVTLIVISHDDRYFHVADRVVVVESGVLSQT